MTVSKEKITERLERRLKLSPMGIMERNRSGDEKRNEEDRVS